MPILKCPFLCQVILIALQNMIFEFCLVIFLFRFILLLFFFFSLQVVELKLGGKDIPVTTANRIAYIHLVADYRLNKQIRPHCLAFRQGLANVVNLEWLRMFDQQEIQVLNYWHKRLFIIIHDKKKNMLPASSWQVLISGALVPICLDDLKNFTNYSGRFYLDCTIMRNTVMQVFMDKTVGV